MKNLHAFFGFIALGLVGIVACSNSSESTRASASAAQEAPPTPAPVCSADQGEEQCITCCAGTGPVSQIVADAERCFAGCGEKDEACWDRCWEVYDQACATLGGDACQNVEACIETSCFGKEPCDDKENCGGNEKQKRRRH